TPHRTQHENTHSNNAPRHGKRRTKPTRHSHWNATKKIERRTSQTELREVCVPGTFGGSAPGPPPPPLGSPLCVLGACASRVFSRRRHRNANPPRARGEYPPCTPRNPANAGPASACGGRCGRKRLRRERPPQCPASLRG